MLAVDAPELLDQVRQVLRVQVGVLGARELRLLGALQRLLERLARHAHHDLPEHLDEAAVRVAREPEIPARLPRQTLHRGVVQTEVEDGVHHARHRELGAGTHRDEERVLGVAEAAPHPLLEAREVLLHLLHQSLGELAPAQVRDARLGGDREPRGHRKAHVRHLGEIGALPAEEVLHVLVALVEVVHVLGHGCLQARPSLRAPVYGTAMRSPADAGPGTVGVQRREGTMAGIVNRTRAWSTTRASRCPAGSTS
ncbi:MAG: hypothetical protein KatS3mg014_2208 [Actinomycetota bacterium]|nr:MAG: hypothetical protein KatS3mg014_2208 [Actinomycetota bacterium]